MYAIYPTVWASKLRTLVALSITEAEYIVLSSAICDVIPIMQLIKEIKKGFQIPCMLPHVHCKAFEDNLGELELARVPKMHSTTKHIAVCYHHCHEYVRQGKVKIFLIGPGR